MTEDLIARAKAAYTLARGSVRDDDPGPHWDELPPSTHKFYAAMLEAAWNTRGQAMTEALTVIAGRLRIIGKVIHGRIFGDEDGQVWRGDEVLSTAADALEARPPAIERRGAAGTRETYRAFKLAGPVDARTGAGMWAIDAVTPVVRPIARCLGKIDADLILSALAQQPMGEVPWDDCKVAFGFDDPEVFEAWMEETDDGRGLLPEGWTLCECDGSGARYVVVFRVEGPLRVEDGIAVQAILAALAGAEQLQASTAEDGGDSGKGRA